MAQKIVIWDDALGRYRASATTLSQILSFTTYDFNVGVGGASTFLLPVSITSLTVIDVYISGLMSQEGSGFDWTRNTSTHSIVTTFTVPQNGWVRVRVYA